MSIDLGPPPPVRRTGCPLWRSLLEVQQCRVEFQTFPMFSLAGLKISTLTWKSISHVNYSQILVGGVERGKGKKTVRTNQRLSEQLPGTQEHGQETLCRNWVVLRLLPPGCGRFLEGLREGWGGLEISCLSL